MDVTDLARRLARRWLAVAQVVLLAVLAAAAAWTSAGSSDQSTATVVIVPPTLGEAVSDQNPLLNLNNNMAQLATVLASSMQSQAVANRLESEGATASYTISTVTGTNPSFAQLSPQVVFTVTASSARLAERTSTALVSAAEAQLDELQFQAGVPAGAKAQLVTVVSPTTAVAAGSGRLRAAGGVGLGVVVLGLLFVLLVDELVSRRRSRRRPEPSGATGEQTVDRLPAGSAASAPSTARTEPSSDAVGEARAQELLPAVPAPRSGGATAAREPSAADA